MEKKVKFGFTSQGYEAPRAESVAVGNEGLLCASIDGALQGFTMDEEVGDWGTGN